MYRILIVDDEEIITNSMVNLLQSSISQADVYAAFSGDQALQYVHRAGFDILITDIQMPGMSGIELVRRVKDILPQCKAIFLSGHDDFDYAYQAMQLHAVRYILKNEKDEVIVDTVRQCIEEIEEEARNQEMIAQANEYMLQCKPYLKREYLEKLIHKEEIIPDEAQSAFIRHDIHLSAHMPFLLLAGRIDEESDSEMPTAVDMVVRNCLEPALNCECCEMQPNFMLWLIQSTSEDKQNRTVMQVRAAAERLQRTCMQSLHASVSFILHTALVDWKDIQTKANEMYHVVGYMLEPHERMAFVYLDYFSPELWRDTNGNHQGKKQLDDLAEAWQRTLRGHDSEALQSFGHKLQALVLTMPEQPGDEELLLFHRLNAILLDEILQSDSAQSLSNDRVFHLFLNKPTSGTSVQLAQRLIYLGEQILEIQKQHQKNREEVLIRHINDYIVQHLGGDLSLVALSEKMYLNPSYLSRRYKEISGENMSDVITRLRVERAMELLKDGNMKINAIAEQVGYLSATHFIRVFRKYTGYTPQEWRGRQG